MTEKPKNEEDKKMKRIKRNYRMKFKPREIFSITLFAIGGAFISSRIFCVQKIIDTLGVFYPLDEFIFFTPIFWTIGLGFALWRKWIEKKNLLNELQKLAACDSLTGLWNLRTFYSNLKIEVSKVERYKTKLSILIFDIDDFKNYNDAYGHLMGDKILTEFAETINSISRESDTAYRYGGDEFVMLLAETIHRDAEKIGKRIQKEFVLMGIDPTVSFGSAQYKKRDSIKSFIKRADVSLFKNKKKKEKRSEKIIVG